METEGTETEDRGEFEIELRVSAVDRATNEVAAQQWAAVPDGVDAYNVESMVKQAFGAPLDRALDHHDVHGVLQIGWYFPSDGLAPLGLPTEGNDALVIPYARFEDGFATPLSVLTADERAKAEALFGADHVKLIDARTTYGHLPDLGADPAAVVGDVEAGRAQR